MTQAKEKNHIVVKEREKHSLSFYLLIVLAVGMLLRFYFSVFFHADNAFVNNFSPLLSVAICAIEVLCLCIWNIKISYKAMALFMATFVFIVISMFFNTSGVEHAFGLFSVLIGIYALNAAPLQKREQNGVLCAFVVSIALILLNGALGDMDSAVLGKFNPNTCAFLLTMLYCVCFMRFCRKHTWLDAVLAVVCFLLQFVYISRTALLGEIIFTFCALVCRAWRRNTFSRRTVFWVILCFSIFGLILAYFYSKILYPAVGHGEVVILGKDVFTGRQTIWNFAFDSIRENIWFGVGSHLNEAQFEAGYYELIMNAHNQAVGTLAAFGLFAFVLFYIAFSLCAARPYRCGNDNKVSRFPAIFLLTITIMSYFDIYFFSGYNWIAILIAYGLILSHSREKA